MKARVLQSFGVAAGAGLTALAPLAVGVVPVHGFLVVSLLSALALGGVAFYTLANASAHTKNRLEGILLAATATCATVAMLDIAARPLSRPLLHYRPSDMYIRRWNANPSLTHYDPNVLYVDTTYGDLAAQTGETEDRQYREEAFSTDAWGFRNDSIPTSPVDIIVLGDSFAAGTGTTQSEIISEVLKTEYRQITYNLAAANNSPWQSYAALAVHMDSIPTHGKTVVAWLLFVGNDLEDLHDGAFGPTNPNEIETFGFWIHSVTAFQTFRYRSPLRQSVERLFQATDTPVDTVGRISLSQGKTMLTYKPYERRQRQSLASVEGHLYYQRLVDTLLAMERLANANDLKVLVIIIPDKTAIYGPQADTTASGFATAVESVVSPTKMCFLDLATGLRLKARSLYAESGDVLWWLDDSHWNGLGHAAAADLIMQSECMPE